MSETGRLDCVPCNKFKHWLEFQLLDNQSKPLAGIPYNLKSRDGVINASGVTDGQGILREENLSSLPMTLHVDAQKLADQLTEKSPAEAMEKQKGTGAYHQLMPGDISDTTPEVAGWTKEALLHSRYYPDPSCPGFIAMPGHNRRHVLEIARIAKPVFAKSCLQPAGCTDAGTETEPHTHFGQMQVFQPKPAVQSQKKLKSSEPWYLEAIAGLGNLVFSKAEANPILIEYSLQAAQQTQAAMTGTTAIANHENNGKERETRPLLSSSEKQKLDNIRFSMSRESYLTSASAITLGMMIRNWWDDSDKDLLSHENLKDIADKKGTAPTRVRYRFVENAETGQLTAVGYHTSEESGLEQVKVRNVQYNESLNRYEFWEDDAASPTLAWYLDTRTGELSQSDIDKYAQQDASINAKVAVLDPEISSQTPGLPIPEQRTWRDGVYINPQQDPKQMGDNATTTPIPDENRPTTLTTPKPEQKSFRDYILIFPVSNVPAIYVYLSSSHGKGSGLIDGIPRNPGTARRFMSKKEFKHFQDEGFVYNPEDSRGGISVTSVKVDPKNPDAIKRSTGALGADYYVDIDTTNKNVELKGKTKGGVMDWKIKDNVTNEDIIKSGRVKK
ncbi:S-type pyocin domain-containing protein [Xenorhabdus khoisanae]|uniref:S-type pyocin domain-containing protein n=1 Tax=Xenorhabdus khoisanae TaxID=880157 RepID=UPI0023593A6B|nr:S-type pyocin domain-containing protein [Xenorhabdus khoisanae]MDC9612554.1 S-type pyocin domain-containing protein [Xenorhabdus khoisanae]